MFLQVELAYPVELPDEEDELAWEAAQRGPRGEVREERQDLMQRVRGRTMPLLHRTLAPPPPRLCSELCASPRGPLARPRPRPRQVTDYEPDSLGGRRALRITLRKRALPGVVVWWTRALATEAEA